MKPVHLLSLAPFMVAAACVPMAAPDVPVATTNLISSSGAVLGTVRVFSEPTGVLLRVNASGLPAGLHGVHVHTTGRCDAPAFTTAGGHWNPTMRKHGHKNPAGFHGGDLGNLGVGADGKAHTRLMSRSTSPRCSRAPTSAPGCWRRWSKSSRGSASLMSS